MISAVKRRRCVQCVQLKARAAGRNGLPRPRRDAPAGSVGGSIAGRACGRVGDESVKFFRSFTVPDWYVRESAQTGANDEKKV